MISHNEPLIYLPYYDYFLGEGYDTAEASRLATLAEIFYALPPECLKFMPGKENGLTCCKVNLNPERGCNLSSNRFWVSGAVCETAYDPQYVYNIEEFPDLLNLFEDSLEKLLEVSVNWRGFYREKLATALAPFICS